MKLIIAEKPSLARNIAAAIGNAKKQNNAFICGEWIVTWAFGHLFTLADVEKYSPNRDGSKLWTVENLPCFPKKFEFELKKDKNGNTDDGVRRQFELIKMLCLSDKVDTIVNAGDADREGEIIVRTCIMKTGVENKPIKRLWLPDQTAETINAALLELKDDDEYDRLAKEGYARTFTDWLYGVNLTRYATLKTGTLMRVGRVIVPIVKAIYDRDAAIRAFKPEIYYSPVGKLETDGEETELASKLKFSKNELDKVKKLCEKYNTIGVCVKSVKKKKDVLRPGKLYSLTKLQNVLGKKYKMPMEESLKITQELYEKGYVTYPRTNSEYMATAEKDKVKKIIGAVASLGYSVKFKDGKTIFDDSKIESHSALTPTHKIPSKDTLSEKEAIVYSAILRRFVAVFCSEECVVRKTEITFEIPGEEEFLLKGITIEEKGWTKYDDYSKKDKILPNVEKGQKLCVDFAPKERETTPPKHYTIETLNNYLKNPFREEKAATVDDDNDEYRAMFDGLELGTEATRTGIIENAIKSKYIARKKDVYTILPAGEELIKSIARMGISMDKYKTSVLGRALKKVYKGEITVKDCLAVTEREIAAVFDKKNENPQTDTDDGFVGDTVGKCPLCASEVVRTRFGYGCAGYKNGCRFSVNNVILGRVIPKSCVDALLKNGKSQILDGFVSQKSGKSFSAALKLAEGRVEFDFSQ